MFQYPAAATPLILYMLVFCARYGLAIWAGFQPSRAMVLNLVAIAVSAATAGRFAAEFMPLLRALNDRAIGLAPEAPGPD